MNKQDPDKPTYEEFRKQVCSLADRFIRDNGLFRIEVNFIAGKSIIVSTNKKDLTECTVFRCILE